MAGVTRAVGPHSQKTAQIDSAATEGTDAPEKSGVGEAVDRAAEFVEDKIEANEDRFRATMLGVDKLGKVAGRIAGEGENAARVAGAVAGAVAEAVHPTPSGIAPAVKTVAGALSNHAEKVTGMVEKALDSGAGRMAEGALKGVGVASVAYSAYKGFTDQSFETTGGKVANGVATSALAAAGFVPGAGEALMVAEVVSGGGVSGTVKGMVAMGEGIATGDHKALDKWKADAKSGEHGWVVKAVANNETASTIANAVGTTVVGGAVKGTQLAVKGTELAAHAVAGEAKRELNEARATVAAVSSMASSATTSIENTLSSGWSKLTSVW
jgi:hypothetical protein